MSIVPAIVAALGLVPSIFKHKPNCLWYWTGEKWILKAGPMSSRQCRKQKATLVYTGLDARRFIILRQGVTPDPIFNPPKPKEGK